MRKMLKIMMSCAVAVLGFMPWAPGAACAADFSAGLGGGYASSPYKQHDGTILPFLPLFYEGERFYLNAFGAGAFIWKGEMQDISVGLSYSALAFDSDKTDDTRLQKLDDRHATILASAQYRLRTGFGHLGLRVSRDILGKSDGFSAELSYMYPFEFGSVRLSPGAGMRWDSKEQVDYYYGVSGTEARKSGLNRYRPDGAFSPYVSLAAQWAFADKWSLNAGGEVLFLGSEIQDSPMVDKARTFSVGIALNYTF